MLILVVNAGSSSLKYQLLDVFSETVMVDDEVIDKIDALAEIAPVHNHGAALALRAGKSVMPNTPMTVVFDTAFHQTMPKKAYTFGLPYEDQEEFHVRKYGFHGTSHRFVSAAVAKAMGYKGTEDNHLPPGQRFIHLRDTGR